MSPLASFWILAGMTGPAICLLALAMPRHGMKVFSIPTSKAREQGLRFSGWFLLIASFLAALGAEDGAVSLVSWFALLAVQAFAVTLILTYTPRLISWWAGFMTVILILPAIPHVLR